MVTGCDNIMDDEYKETLVTDLPGRSLRFRSVLDIMVSDRILCQMLFKNFMEKSMSGPQFLDAIAASISALTRSAAQEASEEGGVDSVLPPEQVLETVHHFKTGLLFMCSWSVPRIIENCSNPAIDFLLDGLYKIGLGCQVMDDIVDLLRDVKERRHNFVASLIYYRSGADQWGRLQAQPHELSGGEIQRVAAARALAHYPKVLLADEPTASLDTETGRMLVDLMLEIGREQGCTQVISTHDLDLLPLADKIIHLKDGRVKKEEVCEKR